MFLTCGLMNMKVLLTRRLGRVLCGVVLCSVVSFAKGEEEGAVVFIDDQGPATTPQSARGRSLLSTKQSQPTKTSKN